MGVFPPSRQLAFGGLVIGLLLCTGLRAKAQSIPTYPAWWSSRGVLSGTTSNDFAVANQGQAKNIAVAAVNELNADLAQFGGAGNALNTLAIALTATSAQTSDYTAVNLGQLKALTKPIYDRLILVGYGLQPLTSGTAYPWVNSGNPPDDYALANLGQLKYLFSFDVTHSSSSDGIPDWWAHKYFPGQTISPTADPSGDGLTNYQNYEDGTNPILQVNPAVGLQVEILVQ
jgi:hypothetical protein